MDKRRMVSVCLTVGIMLGAALALVGCSGNGNCGSRGNGNYFYANGSYWSGGNYGPGWNGVDRCAPPGLGTQQSRDYYLKGR